jgi:hypothetical protein
LNFDFVEVAKCTKEIIISAHDINSGMDHLVNLCQGIIESPAWPKICSLDYKRDIEELRKWLELVLISEPPSPKIKAFWFGLYNPVLENGDSTAGLYISGSTRFDSEDTTGDWAVWDDSSYLPKRRYADSVVLKEIYRLVTENEVADIGEYVLCLGYAFFAVREICSSIKPSSLLLGEYKERRIAVGFDSGDFIILPDIL